MALGMFLREQVTVILSVDDAIDPAEYDAYVKAGFDERALHLKGEPTRFTLRRLTYDQVQHVDALPAGPPQNEFIVRASLTAISGYHVHRADGTSGELKLAAGDFEESREYERNMLKHAWLRSANLPPSVIMRLAAISRLRLSEADVPFVNASAPPAGASE